MTEHVLTPLLLLKTIFQIEFIPLLGVPIDINSDLDRFGRRNLWNGMFHASFYSWVLSKHRGKAWISKFSHLRILALHKIWSIIFSMCNESACSRITMEDHKILKKC